MATKIVVTGIEFKEVKDSKQRLKGLLEFLLSDNHKNSSKKKQQVCKVK